MMGSKGTRAGIRVMQAYTVAAVSAFFDRRRRRHRAVASRRRRVTCLITLNYPRLHCLHCLCLLVGHVTSVYPVLQSTRFAY